MAGLRQWLFGRKDAGLTRESPQDSTATQSAERLDDLIARGNMLEDHGDFESALAHYREAASIAPDSSPAYVNVGNALQLMGRLDDALVAQETAVRLAGDNPAAHYNLGALLARKNDVTRAERELREALRLKPDMANAAIMLADVLEREGRLDEAEAQLRRVLEESPQSPGAAHNLWLLLLKQERIDDAEDVILHAKSLNPGSASLCDDLGSIYVKTSRHREAERVYREALSIADHAIDTVSSFLFSLNFRNDLDAESVFLEHKRLGAMIDDAAGLVPAAFANPPAEDRRLKIGYVSADFRQHPVGLFMRPVLERHDRGHFEVHCYSNYPVDDDLTRTLKRAVAHWHPIAGLGDAAVADQIRHDGIDILVDLSGHTQNSRLPIFSRRPAPVQVTWLGYLNTTGLGTMDYRLCDRHTDPSPAAERLHTERLARLPHSQWCYAPVYLVPVTPQPHPENPDAVVFGSFNQFAKISDACLALWCAVLTRLPKAELRMYGVPEGRTRSALIERLARYGLDPARASLYGRVGILEYFSAIGDVDIALDTFPYNGATTTLDTLWMGVPIVGLQGNRGVARGTYSILCSLRAPEMLAATPGDYVEKNVQFGQDGRWRRELRGSLRARLESSPLMDAMSFVKDLESSYRQMWRAWCQPQPCEQRGI